MDLTPTLSDPAPWVLIAAAALLGFGAFVKGAVGFALPMIAVTGLSFFLTAQEAIALLLIPSCVANIWQTMRQGWKAASDTFLRWMPVNLTMAVFLALTAQFVPVIPSDAIYGLLGVVVIMAGLTQLLGWQPRWQGEVRNRTFVEICVGVVAGIVGGLASVWGPIVLYYLVACGTAKQEQVRVVGLLSMIGWLVLSGAHVSSGILNSVTLPLSAAMLVPVLVGMWIGLRIQDRLNQQLFERLTLLVLIVAGLNLLRRALV